MKLFPYILLRLSGNKFDDLGSLEIKKSNVLLNRLQELTIKIDSSRENICRDIYKSISEINNSSAQNLLLNFKRDIFNGRDFQNSKFDSVKPYLDKNIIEKYQKYLKFLNEYKEIKTVFTKEFHEEMLELRDNLKEIAKNNTLQKGLILSSQSLLKRINTYVKKDINNFDKTDLRTELSLIKYVSRLYTKTSPFSTFTTLGFAKLNCESGLNTGPFLDFKNQNLNIKSHIRINNYLFVFLKTLLLKNKKLNVFFPVRPNPTIQKVDNSFNFLTNNNNIEAFQRLPYDNILDVFLHLSQMHPQGMVFNNIIKKIIENEYIDASYEELSIYMYRLIEYGFLEFNIGVSGINMEWDLDLCDILIRYFGENQLIKELIEVLKEAREKAIKYEESCFEERVMIINHIFERIKNISFRLHEAAGLPEEERHSNPDNDKPLKNNEEPEKNEKYEFKHNDNTLFYFKPEQIYFEDTAIEQQAEIKSSDIEPVIESLYNLIAEMNLFEGYINQLDKLKFFFKEKYPFTKEINLLRFYEDYYRDVRKPEKENEKNIREGNQSKEDPELNKYVNLPNIKQRRKNIEEFTNKICGLISKNKQNEHSSVKLFLNDFKTANENICIKNPKDGLKSSYASFLQFFLDSDNILKAVVNINTAGFGKMFSRFLHVLPDEITALTKSWNKEINKVSLLLENTDASVFNANLHPPLMPYEIWIPGSQNNLNEDKQIPITDILIKYDEIKDSLKLIHKTTNKQIYIFDLCFQSNLSRSNLFQLLSAFSLSRYFSYNSILNEINTIDSSKLSKGEKELLVYPRITFENKLILQRKTWLIDKVILPLRRSDENFENYFLRVNEWKDKNKIDNEVFMIIEYREKEYLSNKGDIKNKHTAKKNLSRDDYKPQYINFKNPFLVNLFEKNLGKVDKYLKIEEMLPGSQNLLNINSQKHVSEFVVQWYDKQ